MRQILLDGQPFTYGDSLEEVAMFSEIDVSRLSWGNEYIEQPKSEAEQLKETILLQDRVMEELLFNVIPDLIGW